MYWKIQIFDADVDPTDYNINVHNNNQNWIKRSKNTQRIWEKNPSIFSETFLSKDNFSVLTFVSVIKLLTTYLKV